MLRVALAFVFSLSRNLCLSTSESLSFITSTSLVRGYCIGRRIRLRPSIIPGLSLRLNITIILNIGLRNRCGINIISLCFNLIIILLVI